jgi:hypothetical protein
MTDFNICHSLIRGSAGVFRPAVSGDVGEKSRDDPTLAGGSVIGMFFQIYE